MPTKPTLSGIIRSTQQIISCHAQAFCCTPSKWAEGWLTTDCVIDGKSGAAFLTYTENPATYPYGKDNYQTYPTDKTKWIESGDALGKGDKGIGWAGPPAATPWNAFLDSTHQLGRNRGVSLSFLWYRPAAGTQMSLDLTPRLDPTKTVVVNPTVQIAFAPFTLTIDSQMRMRVREYQYDNYDAFTTDPITCYKEVYSHPLVVTPDDLSSSWHTVKIIAISDDDVLIQSDILRDGGFIYRSVMDRQNIWMLPEGVAGFQCLSGGTSQVRVTPLDVAATGTLKSHVISKPKADTRYPKVNVFGWSPSLINTDRGYMTNQLIESGDTGTGGIKYAVYAVTKNANGSETETLVASSGGAAFKDFRVVLTLTSSNNVSPVLTDVIVEFEQETGTVVDPTLDISADILDIQGDSSNDGDVRLNFKVRNRNKAYDGVAERISSELELKVDDQDVAVLYTVNPGYDWFKTPNEPALELNWEMGDGFTYLKRELCAKEPPYDGQLLSTVLTEFMGRRGYDESRLDIDATPGLYLPKKRGNESYQYKPEDGCPAADFIKKLKDWFGSEYSCRFIGDGKFSFKAADPTIKRIYYPNALYKTAADDHMIYQDAQVELLMDEFYNEIWVVGEDKRNGKPLLSVYQNLPSQVDKNAPDYCGRRLIMIVLTKVNRQDGLDWICNELVKFHGEWGVRVTFNTRLDPTLQKDDFIQLYGVGSTWRVKDVNMGVALQNIASTANNSTTPIIKGMKVSAVQWPVAI